MINFYQLLEINSNASNEEINKAYKQKMKVHHPDKNNGSQSSDVLSKLYGLAKDTLLDTAKRLQHDYAVGVKKKPEPAPKVVEVPVYKEVVKEVVKKVNNAGQVVGWGLLGRLVGMAIAGSGKK